MEPCNHDELMEAFNVRDALQSALNATRQEDEEAVDAILAKSTDDVYEMFK